MSLEKSDAFDVSQLQSDLNNITNEEIDRRLSQIIEMLKEKSKVITFTGAGISTSAGIPDFRSKDGLYSIVQKKFKTTNPGCVFDLEYFKSDPKPFYCVASKFMEESYKPTVAHCFIKLLFDKGLLLKNFTQNVDGLDAQAGLPSEVNVEVHGHFRTGKCMSCSRQYSLDEMVAELKGKEFIKCVSCPGVVKPDIILFGEAIPPTVMDNLPSIAKANVIIIMGTSLNVVPFSYFISMAHEDAAFLVINREEIHIASRCNAVILETDCDSAVRRLCTLLNWDKDLDAIYTNCH